MTKLGFSLSGLSAMHLRRAVECLLIEEKRLDHSSNDVLFISPLGHDGVISVKPSVALRLLAFPQLLECFADHRTKILEFLCAQVDLHRQGVRLVTDHQGTEWLAFDDSRVDLPADDTRHVTLQYVAHEPAAAVSDSQGGAA